MLEVDQMFAALKKIKDQCGKVQVANRKLILHIQLGNI
jgi:hypothetical protein